MSKYVVVKLEWISDPDYRAVMCSCKGINLIYDLLRRYVIRDRLNHKVSRYIFDNLYSKGMLAASVTYTHLMEKTGLGRATVAKCISNLREAGYIDVVDTVSEAGEKQNIYVLGKRKCYTKDGGDEIVCDFWKIDDVIGNKMLEKVIKFEG